jgi:hypothetical protein
MNCPKCGAPLLQGSTFCGGCGYRLSGGTQPSASPGGINIDEDSKGQGRGYRYEVLHQPSFSLAVLQLQAEQSIQAESAQYFDVSQNSNPR